MLVDVILNNGLYARGQVIEETSKGITISQTTSNLRFPQTRFYSINDIKCIEEIPVLPEDWVKKNVLGRL